MINSLWQKSREAMRSDIAPGSRRRDAAVLVEIRASLDNEGTGARTPAATVRLLPQAVKPYLTCGLLVTGVLGLRAWADQPAPPPANNVTIPVNRQDAQGTTWMISDGGCLQNNGMGGPPVFGQADILNVNGTQIGGNGGQAGATLDPKTEEVVFDNLAAGSVTVSRRILVSHKNSDIRYIDIFKNTQNQPQTVAVMYSSTLNWGVASSIPVTDPKHPERQLGWAAMTQGNRAAVEMFAGKSCKITPTIQPPNNNGNASQVSFQLTIPAGKSVALLHFLELVGSTDQGEQYITSMKENQVLRSIEPAIRKLIVNFPFGNIFAGDFEILRGDAFDVLELRGGDQMRGTLVDPEYKLTTAYGPVTFPKDQVVALFNVGEFRPRQLIVTTDGQIFGGQMVKNTVSLELTSGQLIQVPIAQFSRAGYRKQPGEPEEWTFDKPMVFLRSGDRIQVQMPAGPFDISTRYGPMKLDPKTVQAIVFQSEDTGVHEIDLTDGSKFAGLVNATQFDMTLPTGGQKVTFDASAMTRLQISAATQPSDNSDPALKLANEDVLVGELIGQLKLDTAFDVLTISCPEIKKITPILAGSTDVQVTLWDDTAVSGQLENPTLDCKLISGAKISVPATLLSEYDQPQPHPSAQTVAKIKSLAEELNADDFAKRDQAQKTLTAMGTPVMSILKEIRATQGPEGQQRIDAILKDLSPAPPTPPSAPPG
jgi:hypothetical protein